MPPFFQQREAGAQAHGGEEGQHKGVLEGVGKVKGKASGHMARKGDEHKQESADDRSRNTILGQEMDFLFDKIADQQKDRCHSQGQCCVYIDVQHIFYRFE